MRCRMVVSLMLATTAVATAQTPGRFAMALAVDRLVRTYRVGAPSIRRGGETWEQLERRLRTLAPGAFPASVRKADTSLASLDPAGASRIRAHAARGGPGGPSGAGGRVLPFVPAAGVAAGARRRTDLYRHLQALGRTGGGPGRGRRESAQPGDPGALDRVPQVGAEVRGRSVPHHRCAGPLLGLAPRRAGGWRLGVRVGGSAAGGGANRGRRVL